MWKWWTISLLTYLRLLLLIEEHRPSNNIFYLTMSCVLLYNWLQLLFIIFMSDSNYRWHIYLRLHLFWFPSRFKVSDWLVMQFDDFQIWFVLSHSRLLLIVSSQRILIILCNQLFINTCVVLLMVVVVLQISVPYNITVLMFLEW